MDKKMAAICSLTITLQPQAIIPTLTGIRCLSGSPEKKGHINSSGETPQFLRAAVTGVTGLLRLLSPIDSRSSTKREIDDDDLDVKSVDDVIIALKSDYQKEYFVTGIFTPAIYTEDCIFEDPTIKFRGRELYSRNLKLLVPFFDKPSIGLQEIEKVQDMYSETSSILAKWKLRTYLKLPWKPFISIDGSTIYEVNNEFKIFRHAESWNVSALEAVGQIFSTSFRKSGDQP